MSTSPLVSAACCCLALLVFFFAASPISCFAELAEWSGGGTEMRKDGTCFVGNLGGLLRPRRVPMPSATFPGCGDPLYRVLRWCARQGFYANPGDQTRPKDIYSDSVLLLLNGCLRCPFGEAVAHIRLRHRLPAGSGLRFALPLLDAIFSECKEQEQMLGNLTVHLSPQWPAGARGTFALGAILMGRSCGWMGTEREKLFDELELEIEHNCGRRRPMTLVIPLPSVDLDRLRGQRGQLLEWDGLSLDLAIFGPCFLALFYFGHARRLLLNVVHSSRCWKVGPKEVSVSVNAKPTMHY